ncbi:cellular tumor antigen p53-like [Ornithodoros turicata]|uniref:cellular tumor antigen p53-like n=1 Tax=Ornithodoros turicata TaxID=34597 RepID=UPI00313A06D3
MRNGELSDFDCNFNIQPTETCFVDEVHCLRVEDFTWHGSCMPKHVPEESKLMQDTSVANSNVVDWPGPHDFRVAFQDQEEIKKNMTWTFSEQLRKLYVSLSVACPVHFDTETCPPEGSTICVVPVYKDYNHRLDAVRCCPSHSRRNAENELSLEHWITCDNRSTQYFEDSANQNRLCLTVPFEDSAPHDNLKVTYRFRFMCRNTCYGGPNRRSTQVIFILRSPDGTDLGRSVVEVKVCASPGRDRKREEEHALRDAKLEHPEPPTPGTSTGNSGATKRKYTLHTNSKSVYKMLLKLNAGCDLQVGEKRMRNARSIGEMLKISSSESSSE